MARRIVGLIGKGKGPVLHIGQATVMEAEVTGLSSDCPPVKVAVHHGQGEPIGVSHFYLQKDGMMELPIGKRVQFEYEGDKTVICAVRLD